MAEKRHRAEPEDFTSQFEKDERSAQKALCVIAYIPLLCFLPLLLSRARYVRFHTNQGLSLFVSMLVTNAVILLIGYLLSFAFSVLGSVFYLLALLTDVAFLFLVMIGVYHALTECARELPLVGQARILKQANRNE